MMIKLNEDMYMWDWIQTRKIKMPVMATFEAKRNTYTQLLQQQEIRNMEQNRLWNKVKTSQIGKNHR